MRPIKRFSDFVYEKKEISPGDIDCHRIKKGERKNTRGYNINI